MSASRWFSRALDETTAPWAYCRGLPYRTIVTLELYATLLSVMIFAGTGSGAGTADADVSLGVSGSTDNLGKVYALKKMMTMKYPLCVRLMGPSTQLQSRKLDLRLLWRPRAANQEADDLSNLDFRNFNPDLRVHTQVGDLQWLGLPGLLEEAGALFGRIKLNKALRKQEASSTWPASSSRPSKRPWGENLRTSDRGDLGGP